VLVSWDWSEKFVAGSRFPRPRVQVTGTGYTANSALRDLIIVLWVNSHCRSKLDLTSYLVSSRIQISRSRWVILWIWSMAKIKMCS